LENSFQEWLALKAKISSEKLDVASGGRVEEIRNPPMRNSDSPDVVLIGDFK
jgi:hypothetical protein